MPKGIQIGNCKVCKKTKEVKTFQVITHNERGGMKKAYEQVCSECEGKQ